MQNKWNILNKSKNLQEILKSIRDWKQIPEGKMKEFINFNMEPYNPYLLTNMDKAVNYIQKTISSNDRIMVLGDYDVDG